MSKSNWFSNLFSGCCKPKTEEYQMDLDRKKGNKFQEYEETRIIEEEQFTKE